MAEKLTNQEKYKLHLEWLNKVSSPTKEEIDELQYNYKVGKYAPKKGKGNA